MTRTYRNGATGALLDEYERAVEELKNTIYSIDNVSYAMIVDHETKDKDCESIQSIMNHVVRAGYGYANYIRKQFGDSWTERKEHYELPTAEAACKQLDKMMHYTAETLANKTEITFEEVLKNIIQSSWGQKFDYEQMLEHAIVHILRHRRQIEIFKLKMQQPDKGREATN